MKKAFLFFMTLFLVVWGALIIYKFNHYQFQRQWDWLNYAIMGETPAEQELFSKKNKEQWLKNVVGNKVAKMKVYFNNQAYLRKEVYETRENAPQTETALANLETIYQKKFKKELSPEKSFQLQELYLTKAIDAKGRKISLTSYELQSLKEIFQENDQSVDTLELKQIREIFEGKKVKLMPVEELKAFPSYKNFQAVLNLEKEINDGLQKVTTLTTSRIDEIRTELSSLSKKYGWGKSPISVIDKFLLFLLITYLFFIAYQYFFKEQSSVNLILRPWQVLGFYLSFIYLAFNFGYGENIAGINKLFIGESDFLLIQWSFISKIFLILLMYAILTLPALGIGTYVLQKLKFHFENVLTYFLFSLGLGFGGIILGALVLGMSQAWNIYAVLIFFLLVSGLFYKQIWFWLRTFVSQQFNFKTPYFSFKIFCVFVLGVFLSIAVIALLRPIPTGWDALGVYQNTAQLIGQYGYLISGMPFFNWEIIMSLAHVLFGSTMLALFLSFLGMLLVLLALYNFIREFIHKNGGLLAATIYISLPMVQHFSSSDMKIDNALLFFTILALMAFFYWRQSLIVPEPEGGLEEQVKLSSNWSQALFRILGLALFYFFVRLNAAADVAFFPWTLWANSSKGFTGGIEVLFSLTTIGIIIWQIIVFALDFKNFKTSLQKIKKAPLIVGLFLIVALLTVFLTNTGFLINKINSLMTILQNSFQGSVGKIVLISGGLIFALTSFWALFKKVSFLEVLRQYKFLFLAAIFIGLAVGTKLTTIYLIFAILILLAYYFWGFRGALVLFFGEIFALTFVPYGIILNYFFESSHLQQALIFMALALAIIFLLLTIWKFRGAFLRKSAVLILFLIFIALPVLPWMTKNTIETYASNPNPRLSLNAMLYGYNKNEPVLNTKDLDVNFGDCTSSAYDEELQRYIGDADQKAMKYLRLPWNMTMNLTSKIDPKSGDYKRTVQGLYINISFIFLIIVPFVLFILSRVYRNKNWALLFMFTILFFWVWILSAGQGVIWYALGGFVGLIGIVIMMVAGPYDFKFTRYILLIIISISFFCTASLRLEKWVNPNLFNYAYGKFSEWDTINSMLPDYLRIKRDMAEVQSKYPDRYYLYRVGTFIRFFIGENDKLIAREDNQLDFFTCLAKGKSDAEIVAMFKKLGFRYIMVDLYTTTIEKDWEGSLHQKFKRFVEFINNSPEVKIVYPKISADLLKKHPQLENQTDIPRIDYNTIEGGIIYTFPKNKVQVRHKGYAFLEIL